MEAKYKEAVGELNDIKTAVAVSEMNKEEEIAKIRQSCQQEIETMQALLKGEYSEPLLQRQHLFPKMLPL